MRRQLADDRLTAGFIADGHHLPADTLTAVIRAKGLQRSLLVSDAVALAGLPAGRYDPPVGGSVELSPDGRLTAAGTPYLAGAARCLADGVAHAVAACGLTLAEAISLATVRPGRFAGGRGRIEPGQPAELIRFAFAPGDPALRLDGVWAGPGHVPSPGRLLDRAHGQTGGQQPQAGHVHHEHRHRGDDGERHHRRPVGAVRPGLNRDQ